LSERATVIAWRIVNAAAGVASRNRVASLVIVIVLAFASASIAQQRAPVCAIDMGSNTFRRIVGSFESGKYNERHIDRRTLGVGDDLARHGRISEAKLAEVKQALAAFKAACEKDGAGPAVAIATAAFRDAPNGKDAREIAASLGISMEIATEQRESELAYLVGSLGRQDYAVIDNGSRTIELAAREDGMLRHIVVGLGYRVAYDSFFRSASSARSAISAFHDRLAQEIAKAPFMRGKKKLVGVEFGEMTEILFDRDPVEGRVLTLETIKRRLETIAASNAADFRALRKTEDIDRALPRLVVAAVVTEAFGYSALELTSRELGAGLIIEAGLKQ
jgi:exopolyphosphatase/pppGpp-phosphohydrolase